MIRADDRRLIRMRLAAQRASSSEFTGVAEVVRWMTAMQAQDFAGAKWSIGLRLPGSVESDIDAALADGTIVRSWPMRGDSRRGLAIVRDGEVIGTWKRTLSSRGVTLVAGPFAASSDRLKRGFERAGRQYAHFLETEPTFAAA